jgi:uncharacterized Tic20 family protein
VYRSGLDREREAGMNTSVVPSADERRWAMWVHLSAMLLYFTAIGGFLVPLVIWLTKRETMPFVDDQGKETLNFQITIMLALIGACVLMIVLVGFLLAFVLVLFHFVFTIIAAVQSSEGVLYRYPFCWRVIR